VGAVREHRARFFLTENSGRNSGLSMWRQVRSMLRTFNTRELG
jgi:hypothetical protein